MANEKIHLDTAVVVEGKYDRMRLSALFDCPVIETEGFNYRKSDAVKKMIVKASLEKGIVILTDSDPAGIRIRSGIIELLPNKAVFYNAYVPSVKGKESRKARPGAAGLLGVEGIEDDAIIKAVTDALGGIPSSAKREDDAVMADLFAAGMSGRPDSTARRRAFLVSQDLPVDMSSKQMLRYLNSTIGGEELRRRLDAFSSGYDASYR